MDISFLFTTYDIRYTNPPNSLAPISNPNQTPEHPNAYQVRTSTRTPNSQMGIWPVSLISQRTQKSPFPRCFFFPFSFHFGFNCLYDFLFDICHSRGEDRVVAFKKAARWNERSEVLRGNLRLNEELEVCAAVVVDAVLFDARKARDHRVTSVDV